MSNQEILQKAIEKAEANGWKPYSKIAKSYRVGGQTVTAGQFRLAARGHRDVIFDQDFAKALWNTPRFAINELHFETRDGRSEWEYHLQNMVIAEDPIKYLGNNI